VLKEMGEIALALFCELQAPGTDEDGIDGFEKARRMVEQAKEIFGIGRSQETEPDMGANPSQPLEEGRDARYPSITPAGWEARERPRQLLENILTRQVETCEAQRKAILKESLKGPSPYERAAEIAPTHPNARLMRRMQDSNFREVRRLTNLLLKLKRRQPKMEAPKPDDENEASTDL
ncbi:MAG TPA: hypothetical protein VEN79_11970, partial [Terriglobia bacterium]|nr:hypothetical protein [Terriglobia bacterium]